MPGEAPGTPGFDGALLLESLFLLIVFLLAQCRVSRPLRQLARLCQSFAGGDYGLRMPFVSRDEVGELAQSFNRTADITATLIRDLNEHA
jgi:HAMP domain-containing protein